MSLEFANRVPIGIIKEIFLGNFIDAYDTKTTPPNICLHGKSGSGKSSIVFDCGDSIAKEIKRNVIVIDIRLSAMEPADVLGVPYTTQIENQIRKKLVFSTPEYFPPHDDNVYILFFDELMNCNPSIQKAAYRIINDRTVQNGEKLPDTCMIVAAGNLKEERTGAIPLLPALANRFGMHLILDDEQSHSDYINHFIERDFDRSIVGYLEYRKENMYGKSSTEAAFATPRTWDKTNIHVKNPLLNYRNDLLRPSICGAIGSAIGLDFLAYREHYKILPDWASVKQGNIVQLELHDDGMMYALASSLSFEIRNEILNNDAQAVNNLSLFADQFSNETLIIMFKMLKRTPKALIKIPLYEEAVRQFDRVKHHVNAS